MAPTFSPGAPITRSSALLPLKLPSLRAAPNWSPDSLAPGTSPRAVEPPWVSSTWKPGPTRCTAAPASAAAPTSSPGTPTTRSTPPEPKFPAASAAPNRSPASLAPGTPLLPW